MKIIPLSEGAFTVDSTKKFIPFEVGKDILKERPAGSILVEVQPFVVITSQDILLFDTGLGFRTEDGTMQIHQLLRKEGIDVSSVTKVLMSHLHKDHSGGIRMIHADETETLSFPNATFYIQRQELEFALSGASASYIPSDIAILKNNSRVHLLDGDGEIDGYINYKITSAHSRYHQVFWVRDDSQTVFFGGDDAPQYQQMKSRYVAKYDFDGKKCMQLRHEWWKKGDEEHWTFLFYHDIKTPITSL